MALTKLLSVTCGTAAVALSAPASPSESLTIQMEPMKLDESGDPFTSDKVAPAPSGSTTERMETQGNTDGVGQGNAEEIFGDCDGEPVVTLAIVKYDSGDGERDTDQGGSATDDDDRLDLDDDFDMIEDLDTPNFANGEAVDPEAGAVILCMEDKDGKKIYMVPTKAEAEKKSIFDYIPTGRKAVALTFTAESVRV